MTDKLLAAGRLMYRSLALRACSCTHKFNEKNERVIAVRCLRCTAMQEWRDASGDAGVKYPETLA